MKKWRRIEEWRPDLSLDEMARVLYPYYRMFIDCKKKPLTEVEELYINLVMRNAKRTGEIPGDFAYACVLSPQLEDNKKFKQNNTLGSDTVFYIPERFWKKSNEQA